MNLKRIYLSYPLEEAKVFIDPTVAKINKGVMEPFSTKMTEVNTPEEADCIPLWVPFANLNINSTAETYIKKYPEKCMSVYNFLLQLTSKCSEIQKDEIKPIIELLSSPNSSNITCGLNILSTYKLNDTTRYLIRVILDNAQYSKGKLYLRPYNSEALIECPDCDPYFFNFFTLLVHNDIWNS